MPELSRERQAFRPDLLVMTDYPSAFNTRISSMMLLPPTAGTCPACAVKHPPEMPHNAQSMYYQYRFYGLRGRWPTWADALAHCSDAMREQWEAGLREKGAWSEPADGEPIADPPAETINQTVGDPSSMGFGPDADA
jgi:hypothetical protein